MKLRTILALAFMIMLTAAAGADNQITSSAVQPVDPDVQTMVNQVTQTGCESMLRTLTGYSRVTSSAGCRNACAWARDQMRAYGLDSVYLDTFSTTSAPNVVGILKGRKQVQDSIYLFSAHIDAAGSGGVAPGADDNASGSVSVLLAAKEMSRYTFRNDVRFILFAAEEAGLLGSKDYSSKHKNDKIAAIINHDMLLWVQTGDTDYNIEASAANKPLANVMATAGRDYAGFITTVIDPSDCGGDHVAFENLGFHAIRTLTMLEACQASPHYHNSSDTVGASGNNLPYYTKAVKTNLATIALLAGPIKTTADHPVLFTSNREFSVSFKNGVLRVGLPSRSRGGDIFVFGMNGRLIFSSRVAGTGTLDRALGTVAEGIYQIHYREDDRVFFKSFIVSR